MNFELVVHEIKRERERERERARERESEREIEKESERERSRNVIIQSLILQSFIACIFCAIVNKWRLEIVFSGGLSINLALLLSFRFSINGVPACTNKQLLSDILRTEWGFKGYVISDQGALGK